MKKYIMLAGLLLCIVMLLNCGKKDDNLIGSSDHQVETMRTSRPSVLANGVSSLYITATVYDINGAMAEPCAKNSKAPSSSSIITIGISHHFLRTFRKVQNSTKIENFDISNTPSITLLIRDKNQNWFS